MILPRLVSGGITGKGKEDFSLDLVGAGDSLTHCLFALL